MAWSLIPQLVVRDRLGSTHRGACTLHKSERGNRRKPKREAIKAAFAEGNRHGNAFPFCFLEWFSWQSMRALHRSCASTQRDLSTCVQKSASYCNICGHISGPDPPLAPHATRPRQAEKSHRTTEETRTRRLAARSKSRLGRRPPLPSLAGTLSFPAAWNLPRAGCADSEVPAVSIRAHDGVKVKLAAVPMEPPEDEASTAQWHMQCATASALTDFAPTEDRSLPPAWMEDEHAREALAVLASRNGGPIPLVWVLTTRQASSTGGCALQKLIRRQKNGRSTRAGSQ